MTKISVRAFSRLLTAVLSIAFISSFAMASIWIVDANNGPGTNFTTIQAAINAAQPGDKIIVRAALYNETVTVNKGVTIVGFNATTYPITFPPPNAWGNAIWGGILIQNIPAGQTCVVSGLVVVRPTDVGGVSVALISNQGPVVVDRVATLNGGMLIAGSTDVILQDVVVRHSPGAIPPVAGVSITNSWVQANDLDAMGSDLGGEPDFYPAAGNALEAFGGSVVALARPKLAGGSGAGPWITSTSTPAGGAAVKSVTSIVSIVDDLGSTSYLFGGPGGLRGAGSAVSIPSGNGGNCVEAVASGSVLNKKPMPLFAGPAGANNAGGPLGSAGAPSYTILAGTYSAVADLPALYKNISASVPGGFLIGSHHAAGAFYPVALAIMPEFDLALYPPSVQFAAGNPFNAIALAVGQSNAVAFFEFGFGLPFYNNNVVGTAVVMQTADDVSGTLFLANPTVYVFGF